MLRALLASAALAALAAPAALAQPDFAFERAPGSVSGLEESRAAVLYVGPNMELSGLPAELNEAANGQVERALKASGFKGGYLETAKLYGTGPYDMLLVVGTGSGELRPAQLHELGGKAAQSVGTGDAVVHLGALDGRGADAAAAHLAAGWALGGYSFRTYKTSGGSTDARSEGEITLLGAGRAAQRIYDNDLGHLIEGAYLARDLGNEPGNAVYPEEFVSRVSAAFEGVDNVEITVLDEDDIRREGMGALMGVGMGSERPPRLMVVRYKGGDESGEGPVALVGKGVTFDTGGISIKPSNNMWLMKGDMSGAAAVAGTVLAAAKRGAEVDVVGVMPLAENMPGARAMRPGDIVRTRSGKTVEVLNTDAEGRLLLIDAVDYVQDEMSPRMVVTLATLTGSAMRATGDRYAALFTRDFEDSLPLMDTGERAGEHVWPLPLHQAHFDALQTRDADLKNIGGQPGASTAAAFVGSFVEDDMRWIHLDIAGVDAMESSRPTTPAGNTGWGVRFLDTLLREEAG